MIPNDTKMSTTIRIQRICQHCGNEFTAKTTVTQYCGDVCAKRAYKARKRAVKVEQSNEETQKIRNRPVEELKAKEFLTVRNTATLLNCSVRSVYYYIQEGTIKAVNLGQRITRIRRSDLDGMFEKPKTTGQNSIPLPEMEPVPAKYEIEDCYRFAEVREKYTISDRVLYDAIKRNNIPTLRKGKNGYVPKELIDQVLS